jgi:bacterial/archaeal transporter family protein
METAIILSIVVMLSWGIADVFTALFTRKSTVLSAFLYAQLGMVILYAIVAGFIAPFPILTIETVLLLILAGALSTCGYLAFCKGMQIGPVSVTSAIIGCTPIVTVILTTFFLGENITPLQAVGIALAIVGAALTSVQWKEISTLAFSKIEKSAEYGLIALVSWGIFYAIVDKLTLSMNWIYPLFFAKVVSVIMFASYLAMSGTVAKTVKIPKTVWLFAAGIVVLEFIGHVSYGKAVSLEQSAIVNPISFSYPIVVVGLAHVIFKERLEFSQYIGIACALMGIILLAL